tara:strand:- start:453 stop:1778 length:1326 start_codon:yes stop_codon:yes gene_type:complete
MTANKKSQYLLFAIITLCSFFNAGNSNIYIQVNFIFLSILLIYCLKNKNYLAHLKLFFNDNKISIYYFFAFLTYLILQLVPVPFEFLKIISNEKYLFLKAIGYESGFFALSFSPSNSFFEMINYLSIFIFILLIKMVFYNERHVYRFYYFITLLGAIHAFLAVLIYLNGNPDILFLDNSSYRKSSTGFFTNRTVFSIFLLFCLICGLEYIKNVDIYKYYKKKDNFFNKIYVRIFIIFITIGIITSFSKIGNFLMLLTVFLYLINNLYAKKNINKIFTLILIFIILLDIFVMGYFFGGERLVERYSFLKEDLNIDDNALFISRLEIINFSISQIKKYLIFGYGSGGFETIFKLKFINNTSFYANHAHSDLFEFIGEFGILGFILFILSFYKIFLLKKNYNTQFVIFMISGLVIVLFDFSLHIPLIQILFVTIITLSLIKKNN